MIDLDGIALNGYEGGTSTFQIDLDGFEMGASPSDLKWVERRIGAIPLPDPRKGVIETELPMICHGSGADASDDIIEAMGLLREKAEKIEAASGLGGTEIEWQKLRATYPSTLICFAASIGSVEISAVNEWTKVGKFKLKLTCAPYILDAWALLASGTKPTGVPSADITLPDARGDCLGPGKVIVTNKGTVAQQFVLAGLQWRDAVAGNKMLLPASTLDVSTAPLNGTYTAGTNEVQTLTKTGTISGGTWPLSWDGVVFSAGFAHNAAVATVQAAIDAAIGSGKITVGGSPLSSGNMTFTFIGDYAARNVGSLTFSTSSLTGGGSVALSTTTAGVEGYVSTAVYSSWSSFARTADQTDIGSYQIWARVQDQGTVANAIRVRATWSVGDAENGKPNRSALVAACGAPVWVYLGEAHIKPPKSGTHRWNVTIEAKTLGTEGTSLRLLDVQKVPVENGRLCVKTPPSEAGTLVLSDGFIQSAGSYTGKSMDLGGTVSGGGDADDFTIDTTNDRLQRAATGDTALTGRYVYAGSACTDCRATVEVGPSGFVFGGIVRQGLLFRYVDSSNYGLAFAEKDPATPYLERSLRIYKVVAGVKTLLATAVAGSFDIDPLSLVARSDGAVTVSRGDVVTKVTDAVFATGGALASGKMGIYDELSGAGTGTRTYDNFAAYKLPAPGAAIHPSRRLQWNDDGSVDREASGGTYFAPAAGAIRAGAPLIGAEGAETLLDRLVIATADQNPDLAATTNQVPALDWAVWYRAAYQLGVHAPGS